MQTLRHSNMQLDLKEAISRCARLQPIHISKQTQNDVFNFLTKRLEQLLVDTGIMIEVARAVLSERAYNPVLASTSANELQVDFYFSHMNSAMRR